MPRYTTVSQEETYDDSRSSSEPLLDISPYNDKSVYSNNGPGSKKRLIGIYITSLLLTLLLGSIAIWCWILQPAKQFTTSCSSCSQPSIRKEWRTLTTDEKSEYIRAVKCLSDIPSDLVSNATLHDEFAYVHMTYGESSHESAAFLAWHRYFIRTYEKTLQTRCQYSGSLPYWDWTLDWHNLPESPVFSSSPTSGFGSNGNLSDPILVDRGHCVQDGAFADLQLQFYAGKRMPHCLARGFLPEDLQQKFVADRINDTAMATLMNEQDYFTFLLGVEYGPHSGVPVSVQGDFSKHSAPNEPLFFLHHAQLDRLWWEWQMREPETRLYTFEGPASTNSPEAAKLSDMIQMYGQAESIPARLLMDTKGGYLCYEYDRRLETFV